jgi:hypothetical protein
LPPGAAKKVPLSDSDPRDVATDLLIGQAGREPACFFW